MRRLVSVIGAVGLLTLMLASASGATAKTTGARSTASSRSRLAKEEAQGPICSRAFSLCAEAKNYEGYEGAYTGHDEPATLFYSNTPGSGNNAHYVFRLPSDPPQAPAQDGTGGTPNFMLHPAFWFGMVMCDTQGSPNYTHVCTPDSDTNIFDSPDRNSPKWIGHHPGQAFMELQFYPPGWVNWPSGNSCFSNTWCAALNIDTFIDQYGTRVNNNACRSLFFVGDESINFAFITKNGVAQAPANPYSISNDPLFTALTPDANKDMQMQSGDWIDLQMNDTAAGFHITLHDATSGANGSMTASTGNGFGHVLFQPHSKTCNSEPYAYHPEYSTSTIHTRNTDAAHTYNVSFSDEIGHFEYCSQVTSEGGACADGVTDGPGGDADDAGCFSAALSAKYPIGGCLGTDSDFDGPVYSDTWPGSVSNQAVDTQFHATPILFTSPTFNGGQNYDSMSFETDMPRIEFATNPPCDRHGNGSGCVNPPVGTQFYPIYTTGTYNGTCTWQLGGRFIPGTVNDFGGNSVTEYGTTPLHVFYPNGPGRTTYIYEDFRSIHDTNPCPFTP
jgi:hypothetical protein